jgi:hypothetical protein
MGLPPGAAAILGASEPHVGALRAASPGRSLRRSYQVTPTVPWASTAIAGSNAVTPGRVALVQVRPPSRDLAMPTAPELEEVLASKAT